MRIVFAGTPAFAVPVLEKIVEHGYNVVTVITQEDKCQGRKNLLTYSPVKQAAIKFKIPVFQPNKIRNEIGRLQELNADILITCAYGQILTESVLQVFPKGVWNIHAGLLPFYRGAAPIQNAILNGEKETGVCLMKTELGLDTGDILLCEKVLIENGETYGKLSARLSLIGARLIIKGLELIENNNLMLTRQEKIGARVYKKIKAEDALVDFNDSSEKIINKIHAFNPEPVANTFLDGNRINLFRAEIVEYNDKMTNIKNGEILSDNPKQGLIVKCGNGAIKILELQAAGGKKMKAADFLNGRKAKKGQVFYGQQSNI